MKKGKKEMQLNSSTAKGQCFYQALESFNNARKLVNKHFVFKTDNSHTLVTPTFTLA